MKEELCAFRGIRSSKFRHVYGKASRKEHCYENILLTRKVHDTAACAVNPKFIALAVEVAGGGAFIVLPLDKTGRIDITTPKVTGHKGPIYELKWSPFNDNLIASASDDCSIKLWHIPDGGLRASASEPLFDLQEHQRRVTVLEWHPTADGVLFSAGHDFTIIAWDTNRGLKLHSIDVHPDIIYSLSINRDGSRIATTCRDKRLRVIDPRTGKLLQEGVCHDGPKACKVSYLGNLGMVLTTGFSRYSDRQVSIWRETDLKAPLKTDTIDSSSGVLTPFYDQDTKLVFIAGKGDGNIRYYEITDSFPYCHYLSQHISSEPQRGFGVMPKRGCQISKCEIFRFYKLLASKNLCEPISMIVPRKSDQFQPDIYPDTAAPTPALSLEDWQAGATRAPVLMSMKTGMTIKTHRPVPLRPSDKSSDKNADKKFLFLTKETRADYRTLDTRNLSTSDKDLKTSVNLDTKFQHLQRIWGCNIPARSMTSNQLSLSEVKNQKNQDSNLSNNDRDPVEKLDIKRIESPPVKAARSPFVYEDKEFEFVDRPSPKTEGELRRAYNNQCEEIKLMKLQLLAKDKRIRELEDTLCILKHRQ